MRTAALLAVVLAACSSDPPVAAKPCAPLADATVSATSEGILPDGKHVLVVYYPYVEREQRTPRRVFYGTPDRMTEARIAGPEPSCATCAPCVTFYLAGEEYTAVFGGKACGGMIRAALYQGQTTQPMTLFADGYASGASTSVPLSFVCF